MKIEIQFLVAFAFGMGALTLFVGLMSELLFSDWKQISVPARAAFNSRNANQLS